MLEDIEGLAWKYLTVKYIIYYGEVVVFTGTYVNRRKEGEHTAYFASGHIFERKFYTNGRQHGESIFYHNNGNVSRKEYYKNGLKHGKSVCYNSEGQLLDKSSYKNNKLHGISCVYDGYGKKYKECRYYYGIKVGFRKIWNRNGLLKFYEEYDMCGYKHGYCTNSNGNHEIYYHGNFVRLASKDEKIEKGFV